MGVLDLIEMTGGSSTLFSSVISSLQGFHSKMVKRLLLTENPFNLPNGRFIVFSAGCLHSVFLLFIGFFHFGFISSAP